MLVSHGNFKGACTLKINCNKHLILDLSTAWYSVFHFIFVFSAIWRRHSCFAIWRRHSFFAIWRRHSFFAMWRRHRFFCIWRKHNLFAIWRRHSCWWWRCGCLYSLICSVSCTSARLIYKTAMLFIKYIIATTTYTNKN